MQQYACGTISSSSDYLPADYFWRGEIVFNTNADHTSSEAVASGTPPESSDTTMDAIMEAMQSISSQNEGIKLKIEQQDRKADVKVQEILEIV